jgi:hypothetical protein
VLYNLIPIFSTLSFKNLCYRTEYGDPGFLCIIIVKSYILSRFFFFLLIQHSVSTKCTLTQVAGIVFKSLDIFLQEVHFPTPLIVCITPFYNFKMPLLPVYQTQEMNPNSEGHDN